MKNAIEFRHVSKHFPGVHALNDVSFSVKEGEIHALLGENGAGKSTLLNILHGVNPDYEGDVYIFGEKVAFRNPHDAIARGGISKMHQEINVIPELTVAQNVTLGYEMTKRGCVDYAKVNSTTNTILKKLNCDFRAEDKAATLTAGQTQMLEVAKALFHNSKIISLDEPTSSLTDKEAQTLFRIIGELKAAGITVIYVSHRLDEIFQICDRATILRDGSFITTLEIEKTNRDELIHFMVGRNIDSIATRSENFVQDEVVMRVENYSRGNAFRNINFELKKGEILGFFGLVGAGRTEVMRAIFGVDKKDKGELYLKGVPTEINNSQDALRNNIGLLPEDRKNQGFINLATNLDNVSISCLKKFLTHGFIDKKKKNKNFAEFSKKLSINPKDPQFLTCNLSGGNQQKIILAKWLSTDANILIFDEPTKGIDVGAKMEIYRLMEGLVAKGKSLIVVSSELQEIIGISDRIIVFYEGRKTAELARDQFAEERILNYAMGAQS